MDKAALRKELLNRRRALNQKERAEKSQAIFKRLQTMAAYKTTKCVLVYASMADEVQTKSIIEDLNARGVDIYLPLILSDTEFIPCKMTDETQKNRYGIDEPVPCETAQKGSGKIDLAICPGVGFDTNGNRIGFGKGYYDRYLHGEKLTKIGLAFETQMTDEIVMTKTDVPMDFVVTEKAVFERCE